MKLKTFILSLVSLCAFGQTGNLADYMIGTGPSWIRAASYPLNDDTSFALRLGSSSWYSWTDIVTPIARNPNSAAPLPSTITTGATFVAACNPAKSVCLLVNAAGGVSAAAGGAAAAPAFTGGVGVDFRIGNVHIIPQAKASNAAYSLTSGALATAVFSPSLLVAYGFQKTPVPVASPATASPTVKQMRVVMRRLHLPEGDVK